jgi:RNA polymerase-binding transcription factor DksA
MNNLATLQQRCDVLAAENEELKEYGELALRLKQTEKALYETCEHCGAQVPRGLMHKHDCGD